MASSSSLIKLKNAIVDLGLAVLLLIAVSISDIGFYIYKLRKRGVKLWIGSK